MGRKRGIGERVRERGRGSSKWGEANEEEEVDGRGTEE